MNLLEFLDRIGERRAQRPHRRPRDIRQLIGALFLFGYYLMVWQFARRALPTENLDLIRDAMLTLGPPVGAIVSAMFRSDARDEQMTENTGLGFRAVTEVAKHTGKSDEGPLGTEDEPIHVAGAAPGAPRVQTTEGKS